MPKLVNTFFTTARDGDIRQDKNILSKYGVCVDNLKYMNQIHSNTIKIIDNNSSSCIDKCDGILTKSTNTALVVMVADCIPILIYDTKMSAIGAVHAGRSGSFEKIAKKSVLKMIKQFNIKAKDIKVILGASIQKCCYEVSQKMQDYVALEFGEQYVNNANIDLQGINKYQLLEAGIKDENIKISSICTKCDDSYFSYRRDNKCGRFAGVIEIRDI